MKHLAIFLPSLGGGGAEKVMLTLARSFSARGVRCDLVVAISEGPLLGQIPPGVRLVELGKRKTIHALFSLNQYLRREKPDALLATIFAANICALLASLLTPRRHRTVIREASPSEVNLKRMTNRMAAAVLYRTASQVIAISHGVQNSLIENHLADPAMVRVIHNPTDTPMGASQTQGRRQNLVLACGRLEKVKDYPTLLRAIAQVRRMRDVRLRILGEGSLREALERQCHELGIADFVTFEGYTHDPAHHMREAATFVHSASSEGFGLVLAEALANGCPVIATDCPGGVREVLADGKYGTLVPVGDDVALADAILHVLRGEVEFEDPTTHLRKFDIEHVTNEYLAALFPETPISA